MRTHTIVCKLDGWPVEVEYETEGDGSEPSYSPRFGADSGDPLIVFIVSVWSEEYGHVTLTQEEDDLLAADVCERHEFDDGGDWT